MNSKIECRIAIIVFLRYDSTVNQSWDFSRKAFKETGDCGESLTFKGKKERGLIPRRVKVSWIKSSPCWVKGTSWRCTYF